MPRDYKNTRRSGKRSTPKSSHSWRGFFVGLLIGCVGTAAVFVAERLDLVSFSTSASVRPTPTGSTETVDDEVDKPRFEFYSMLPEMEVAVREEEIEPRPDTVIPPADDEYSSEPEALAHAYVLQVGSFRKYEDADSLKARLALLGLEAEIQTVSINGEQTWHRVRLGPFTERDTLGNARLRLSENNYEAMVFKSL